MELFSLKLSPNIKVVYLEFKIKGNCVVFCCEVAATGDISAQDFYYGY